MPDFGKHSSTKALVALALALLGAASMLYYQFGLFMPRVESARVTKHLAGKYSFGNDFYPVWLTSREWLRERRDPYSSSVTRDIQLGLFGRPLDGRYPTDPPAEYRTFAYPAFTGILFWPVGEVPFPPLRIAWTVLLAGLLAVTVYFWTLALSWPVNPLWLITIILLTVCSYPELEGLYAGQLGLLVGFLLAASLLAMMQGRPSLAGMLMAITMIKPQITLLALFYLSIWSCRGWRRPGRFNIAFFFTMLLLMGASLAVWPHWVQAWIRVIVGYPSYATPPLASELLGGNFGRHAGDIVIAALLLIALLIAWRGRNAEFGSPEFWLTLSLLLAITTLTLIPGQSVYDHPILLPGIFLLASRKQPEKPSPIFRVLLLIGTGMLLSPRIASLGLIIARPILSPERFDSKAVFVLPLRTAAPFPFVVLALLAIAMRTSRRRSAELISSPQSHI